MHTILVEFELGRLTRPVYESLRPELQTLPSERSKVSLEGSGDTLKLLIIAEDVISLRAAVNTWLRLIKIAEDVLNTRMSSS
ncbi:MAG TPA: KEOPS complex subunit Pcc1 [Methanocella sp.]|nr:KEOPS complex subunit Pcc1 [Methanocella sp.]